MNTKIIDIKETIGLEDLEIDSFLNSKIGYIDRKIYIIDKDDNGFYTYEDVFDKKDYIKKMTLNNKYVTMLKNIESINKVVWEFCQNISYRIRRKNLPVSVYCFISPEGSISFDMHDDPDDVLIYVVHGEKCMETFNKEYILKKGQCLFIPKKTQHRAINKKESVILSIGLDEFYMDKIKGLG